MADQHTHCQSCGMPLKRDEKGGGSNADGSTSVIYCSHCFERGEFIDHNISLAQMQEKVRQKLIEFGFPGFLTWILTRQTSKLRRWKK